MCIATNIHQKVPDNHAVQNSQAERVVEAITMAARTGQIGDGKVFVTALDHAVRIRTGETDADAL